MKDVSGVGVERNLFRYRPLPVTCASARRRRSAEGLRVIAAGLLAKSPLTVSTAIELPKGVRTILAAREVRVVREGDGAWLARVAKQGVGCHPRAPASAATPRRSPRRSAALRMSRCGRTP